MTHVEASFTRSMYVTLGIACLALGYAEMAYLPEASVVVGIVGLLVAAAYRVEGRWALTIPAANLLGGAIALLALVWVAYQFARPYGTLIDILPWPTSLLPFLGPLLLVLVPAKLFRPKHQGDFWALQGVGLMAVALGSALAGDGLFGLMLAAYLVSALWSLTWFWAYRQGLAAPPARLLARAAGWVGVLATAAVFAFLLTPRTAESRWELALAGRRLQTGYGEDKPAIDLHSAGTVATSRDVAFEVTATDAAGQPKLDLPPGVRWRGTAFNTYQGGKWELKPWFPGTAGDPPEVMRWKQHLGIPPQTDGHTQLPDLGPEQYYLLIRPTPRVSLNLVLAEPVCVGRLLVGERRQIPVRTEPDAGPPQLWYGTKQGEAKPPAAMPPAGRFAYRQVIAPPDAPNLGPPIDATLGFRDRLTETPELPRLTAWATDLVEALVRRGRLPADVLTSREPATNKPLAKHHEAIAKAFEAHFATSGEFSYSLKLDKLDGRGGDPVEEFVLSSKQGHCNRYATALALALRTQGVPARVVLGFHGADNNGDGTYTIRQSHAHSWVEAVVERPGKPENPRYRMLTLDGTPYWEADETEAGGFDQWWHEFRSGAANFFRNFIVDYNAEQQQTARETLAKAGRGPSRWAKGLTSWLTVGRAVVALGLLVPTAGLTLAVWRLRRRPSHDDALATTLAGLLRRVGQPVRPGDTPAERAGRLERWLTDAAAPDDLASLPGRAVAAHYVVRYGGGDDRERFDWPGLRRWIGTKGR